MVLRSPPGEKVWQLPLVEAADLAEELKSPIADLKNLGGRYAGSITAALFLKEFVDTDKVRGGLRLPAQGRRCGGCRWTRRWRS